jgi:WS/DGAT/MGAT family acyltransferase
VVLYLCSTAIRRYLLERGALPERSLTVGFPANIREPGDERAGTVIGLLIAELATDVDEPRARLEAIVRSAAAAKAHLRALPPAARAQQSVVVNGPWFGAMSLGWGGLVPASCNVLISNVVGPREPVYLAGARLEALYPVSLVAHGTALNITCVSYADTMNVGLIGARDALPQLQRMARHMADGLGELEGVVAGVTPRRG